MRRSLLLGLLCLGLGVVVSAQQHGAVSASAPAPAMHAIPAAPAPQIHVAPAHAPAPSHPVVAYALPSSNVKPVVPHRRTVPPPVGGTVNRGAGSPAASNCNKHFSYPIQGLNACSTPGGVVPFYGGAYYIPIPYDYSDTSAQDQELPQGNADELAANAQQDSNLQEPDQNRETAEEMHLRVASSNINDSLAEFVFVERDGSRLYAVAYSFMNDKLHYVTKEGVRHSVALDSLDLNATQKSNEQLGNTVNLPGLPPSGVASNLSATPLT